MFASFLNMQQLGIQVESSIYGRAWELMSTKEKIKWSLVYDTKSCFLFDENVTVNSFFAPVP